MMNRFQIPIVAIVLTIATGAVAQDDHLQCFKIKDPLRLKGMVALDSAQFGLDEGCKIGRAKYFRPAAMPRAPGPENQTSLQASRWRLPGDLGK